MKRLSFAIFALVALTGSGQTDHAHHDMEDRGNQGMGFAQDKTTHHFLFAQGRRNDPCHRQFRRR